MRRGRSKLSRAPWEVYAPQMAAYVQRAKDPRDAPAYGVPGGLAAERLGEGRHARPDLYELVQLLGNRHPVLWHAAHDGMILRDRFNRERALGIVPQAERSHQLAPRPVMWNGDSCGPRRAG